MKIFVIALLMLLMTSSCGHGFSTGRPGAGERERLDEVMAKNVPVGMSKEALLQFFRSQGWDAVYGKLDNAYQLRFPYRGKGWDGAVTIVVWLDEDGRVKRFKVTDNYIAP